MSMGIARASLRGARALVVLALLMALLPFAAPTASGQPGLGDAAERIEAAQVQWSSYFEPTYTLTYTWSCPPSAIGGCLGVGDAGLTETVTTTVIDGVTIGAVLADGSPSVTSVAVPEMLALLAASSAELNVVEFDFYGTPTTIVYGPNLCLGPPATPDDPGGCPGAPHELTITDIVLSWGVIDDDLDTLAAAHASLWDSHGLDDYSFTVSRRCFCPSNSTRVVVIDGVAESVPTPIFQGEAVLEPTTIDALIAEVSQALDNRRDSEVISWDGEWGFPRSFLSSTEDPLIADGFYGFEITDFSPLGAVLDEQTVAASTWAEFGPSDYRFTFRRSCFCPPPFAPVTITVINGEIDSIEGSDLGEFFDGLTIDDTIASSPVLSGTGGSLIRWERDPAWGFPIYRLDDLSVLGLLDGTITETITDFVPLNPPGRCNGLTPTITGTDGPDVLVGTDGDDVIAGGLGDDEIYGLGGNDTICGGPGDDLLAGGDGDDHLAGDTGQDAIHGQPGDDVLEGGDGPDHLWGQSGNDRLIGGPDNDTLTGGRGDDAMYGDDGADIMRGGTGDDEMYGADGADVMKGNGGSDTLYGGDGFDDMTGGPRPDIMFGGAGIDLVRGFGGADVLSGGPGDDDIRGGRQPDLMNGNDGNDDCNGGSDVELVIVSALNCETVRNIP